jgi:hypothetical protein
MMNLKSFDVKSLSLADNRIFFGRRMCKIKPKQRKPLLIFSGANKYRILLKKKKRKKKQSLKIDKTVS